MTLNYIAVTGSIKLVLFDDRIESKNKGVVEEIMMSEANHLLVSIPH